MLVIVVVIVIGTILSIVTYKQTAKNIKEDLLKNAASIAGVLDTSGISSWSGVESDIEIPSHIAMKRRLEKALELNGNLRFVYLWGFRDGHIYFMIDSEPPFSEDYSPPGQIYGEATKLDRDMFLERLPPSIELNTDRWGTWLSALTPIMGDSGELLAVMGIDMNADQYYRTLYVYTAIPIVVTIFVILLMLIGLMLYRKEEEFLGFKSELVAIASHEIRSPLTGISWLTENLIKSSDNLPQKQKDDLNTIRHKCHELIATINDLLSVNVLEKLDKRKLAKTSIGAKAMFEEIKANAALNLAEKKIELVIDEAITPETNILGDKEQIDRLFDNLISNAIKYSKDGGKVSINFEALPRSQIFSVKDTGIGISKDDAYKVFKEFFRSKAARLATKEGTGLGLRYVKQVAELHSGKVWFESEEGKGSTFYVELPV